MGLLGHFTYLYVLFKQVTIYYTTSKEWFNCSLISSINILHAFPMARIQNAQDTEGPGESGRSTFGVDGDWGWGRRWSEGYGTRNCSQGQAKTPALGFDITMIKYLRKQLKGGLGLWLQSMQSIMVRRIWNSRVIHIMVNRKRESPPKHSLVISFFQSGPPPAFHHFLIVVPPLLWIH